MPDVAITAPIPVPLPPPTKARLVAADGRSVALSWAPQEVTRDGSAAEFTSTDRVGRKPVIAKTAEGLESLSFQAIMGNLDLAEPIEAELVVLETLAREGVVVQFVYGGLEAGWWFIERLSISSRNRNPTNQVTRATVDITLTESNPSKAVPGSLTKVVNPPTTGGGTTPTTPGGVKVSVDLNNWKWTAPYGKPEDPTEVGPPVPSSFSKSPYFVRNNDKTITLRAPCKGVSTSSSGYVRSEFREMKGSKLAAWDSSKATNTLILTTRVDKLPKVKQEAVTAQIHDANDDVLMIRHVGSKVFLSKSKGKGKGADLVELDGSYKIGNWYTVRIVATAKGITVTYKVKSTTTVRTWVKKGTGWYFKAGIYNQSTEAGDQYAEATIRELRVGHGSPLATSPPPAKDPTPSTTTVHFQPSGLTEPSGLAYNLTGSRIFTMNDENTNPNVYAIDPTDGDDKATFSIGNGDVEDPEAIATDRQDRVWLADIGDNDAVRSNLAIWMIPNPGDGNHGNLTWTKYPVKYSDGKKRNAEAFIINPVTNERYVISKESTSLLFKLQSNLSKSSNTLKKVSGVNMGKFVTDAAFTPDGKYVLVRYRDEKTTVYVYKPSAGWARVGFAKVPSLDKPEGIAVHPGGKVFAITEDKGASGAALITRGLEKQYQSAA